ncbi:spore coat protein [Alicyclobacillus suci]|uniref:spore coat protein n=1 Tax=Alicyclobacillus suci TaxID=2816080 RepID=UPI001A8DA10E|nr:spore coat protein [Alicyclobacillus suci]
MQPLMQNAPANQSYNHGGHELFDVSEVLSGTIHVLDQYLIFRQYVRDSELISILSRQYQHILNAYNAMVETFSTGRAPNRPYIPYQAQPQQIVYGLEPTEPKRPSTSIQDINDQSISGYMLGLIKSAGSLLTMSAMEVTNPSMRRLMAQMVPCYIEMAYEIFLYQNKRRDYQVPQLSQPDMAQSLTSFQATNNVSSPVNPSFQ